MKKKQKGFTLIELLVVVAIIGILAAVGVVAYSGYTAGAKKSASKSNQGAVVKYIAAEMKKCSMGNDKAMQKPDGTYALACTTSTGASFSGSDALTAANAVLNPEFKNPYNTKVTAIATGATATAPTCSKTNRGKTTIGSVTDTTTSQDTIYVHTCFSETAADVMSNSILVE